MRRIKSIQSLLAALLVTALLSACTTLVYNKADWWIPWYVDELVDISRDQKAELKEALTPFLEWHRNEELERYLLIIDHVEADLEGGVTANEVRRWFDEAVDAIERVEQRMLEVSIEFGEELSDEQMQEFMASLWEQQEDYEEEYLERTDEEYEQDSVRYMSEFMERFIGRLTDEQSARFEVAATELIRFDHAWLQDRQTYLETIRAWTFDEQGFLTDIIEANDLEQFPRRNLSLISEPRYYAHSGDDKSWSASAERGRGDDKDNLLLLRKRVVLIHDQSGTRLDTHALDIDLDEQVATSNRKVTVVQGNNRTTADGIEVRMNDETLLLKPNVESIYAQAP